MLARQTSFGIGADGLSKNKARTMNLFFAQSKRKRSCRGTIHPVLVQSLVPILKKPAQLRETWEHQAIASFLESIDSVSQVLDSIPPEGLMYLAQNCKLLDVPALTVVCRMGEASAAVYYVLEGTVVATQQPASGISAETISKDVLGIIRPGRIFGETGVLSKIESSLSESPM